MATKAQQPPKMLHDGDNDKMPPEEAATANDAFLSAPRAPTRFQIPAVAEFLGRNVVFQAWYGATFGFFLYFSMYALRRPFKAAKYLDEDGEKLMWFDSDTMSLKTAIVLMQLLGYMTSKWIAIKVVSEAKGRQDIYLAVLGIVAELTLVVFGILGSTAPNLTPFALFFNGLMLGMVWGLTVAYGEGRTTSDFFLVALCVSFIVSSGIVKDVALVALLEWKVDQFWTPALVGLMFLPLYFVCIFMLNQLPPPTPAEELHRADRVAMNHQRRWDYFVQFWPGLLALWVGVIFLTAHRDYRDTFAVELLEESGAGNKAGNLSKSESIVAGILLIPIASLVFCKNNLLAFQLSLALLITGSLVLLLSVYTYLGSSYNGFTYYVLTGVGTYLAYVPYNSVLYERLIAVMHQPCNVAFLMAVMDALGYLGVFVTYIAAEFYSDSNNGRLGPYNAIGQFFSYIMIAMFVTAAAYFLYFKRNVLYVQDGKKLVVDDNVAVNMTTPYFNATTAPTAAATTTTTTAPDQPEREDHEWEVSA